MINPAFIQYPEEARLLGELVLGYGEIDILFAMMAGNAIRNRFPLLHAVNQVRSEKARIDVAHAMSVDRFKALGLAKEYARIHKAVRYCLKVRNQWAHSQWANMEQHGLAFTRTDGDVFASPVQPTVWNSITAGLLRKQEAFFENTRLCLIVVDTSVPAILAKKGALLPMPPEMHEPSMQSQWSKQALAHIRQGQPTRS